MGGFFNSLSQPTRADAADIDIVVFFDSDAFAGGKAGGSKGSKGKGS